MTYPFVGPIEVPTASTSANPVRKDQFDTGLAGKSDTSHNHNSTYAAVSHTHATADVTSGTFAIARIPTGTSGTTVALGNHVHSGADITSGTVPIGQLPTGTSGTTVALGNHAHAGADITSGTVAYARLPVGTAASTVAAGDDSRITGAVQTTRTITAGTGLTGGGDLSANRTLTVSYGTAAGTAAQGNDTRLSVKPYPPVTLTDAATVAVDASLGTHFRLTGTTTRAFGNPTNPTDGQVITIEIKASSGTPNHTWGTAYTFGSDITGTTALVAGKTDFVQFVYNSSVSKWLCIGYVKGYTT